ncbi:XRE family transcriptional regulator [Rhizobium hidalgonense]|uniref:Transcriptional regulator n=1 Tax=Rhizobium hidalgonense TaxID=1538159 RepID=A0A2A6K9L2_9HYPH|nr:transcriptional regulator [Rhizobium hidalgonense]MDR9777019.1 XRE family transcriptional regulator [Rhizobium hidalgonense]MDR9814772.1 XRE family transcriptional regulator [Rhizobium hidalgonense]MDR9823558.1 XRE family transcriptional regulator [Rhizobium hidalgonense]PDT21171.1 transcriptional regulator [Rhizobium hidalgonense]
MDQFATDNTSAAARRREARIAKGYSLEDLAVATGLTVEEITAAEEPLQIVPQHHLERIEHVIS